MRHFDKLSASLFLVLGTFSIFTFLNSIINSLIFFKIIFYVIFLSLVFQANMDG